MVFVALFISRLIGNLLILQKSVALTSGNVSGQNPKPGALSLAHNGLIFFDEMPEFNRDVLEALREPLETKQVHIARVKQHITFPCDTLFIGAFNPSPSGFFADDPRCKDCKLQNYSIITSLNDNLQNYLIILKNILAFQKVIKFFSFYSQHYKRRLYG